MIRCTSFDYKTAATHTYFLSGFHLGKFCPKKLHQSPKTKRNRCDHISFVFFNSTQVLCENINNTSVLKQTARWREEVISRGRFRRKCFLKQWRGSFIFPYFEFSITDVTWQNQTTGCSENNNLHITLNHESLNVVLCVFNSHNPNKT